MANRFTDDHHSGPPYRRLSAFSPTTKTFSEHGSSTSQQQPNDIPSSSHNWVDQVKLSLAVMDPEYLRTILLRADPSPIAAHRLGHINLRLEMPLGLDTTVDGIWQFEVISCRLAAPDTMPPVPPMASRFHRHRAIVNQIRRETKLQDIGRNLNLTEAIARLQHALFSGGDIQRILHLPYHGWHRSWWEMVDPSNEFSLPFQRLIRSRRYADGTMTLQYKDQFAYLPPPCFRSHAETALLHIQQPGAPFTTTLAQINQGCQTLGLNHAILIYRNLSMAECQALRQQGVRLYHWAQDYTTPTHKEYRPVIVLPPALPSNSPSDSSPDLLTDLPSNSASQPSSSVNCQWCSQYHCAMQGQVNSPVTACRQFKITSPSFPHGMIDGADRPPTTPAPEH